MENLASDKRINYKGLKELLRYRKWREANEKTTSLMLKACGRRMSGWMREEDVQSFPCTDLKTIDDLWRYYSDDRFGFSVQKEIYLSVGGQANGKHYPSNELLQAFGDCLGYRENGQWIRGRSIIFDSAAPRGHLPCLFLKGVGGLVRVSFDTEGTFDVMSRLGSCGL